MKAVSIPFSEGTFILFSDEYYDKYFSDKSCTEDLTKRPYVFNDSVDKLYYNSTLNKGGKTEKEVLIMFLKRGRLGCSTCEELENLTQEEVECYLLLNNYVRI